MNLQPGTPVDRLVTWSMFASLGLTLASSVLYAVQGWTDPTAALLHILGGALGGLLVVRIVTCLDRVPGLAAATLLTGLAGCAGVVGYGFNTVGVGLGGVDLIDATGVAAVLKPLGLLWPAALLMAGVGLVLARRVPVWCGAGIAVGAVLYPVSRIIDIGWLAVIVDLLLLGTLAFLARRTTEHAPRSPEPTSSSPAPMSPAPTS
ncbi:MAG: hypothetical protein H7Y15_06625 [Pseudonocardia sp.]|nr:hypothetical protein [Pseudonocardia sp.]